ncbi:Uncharacterized protein TCM_002359 [Theobroma cacao]|uniref:Uncharacterized protein n=1 Tax=Theobroma cacao TaxID=3641 RepID=A0A061DM35_THECC|nr:Uncharacterized protein TCM_002359 [Theobroma cacao]
MLNQNIFVDRLNSLESKFDSWANEMKTYWIVRSPNYLLCGSGTVQPAPLFSSKPKTQANVLYLLCAFSEMVGLSLAVKYFVRPRWKFLKAFFQMVGKG